MRLDDLTPEQAKEMAQSLMEKILTEQRGFTPEERELANGLISLYSAANARDAAEYWRGRGQIDQFNRDANHANWCYDRFEEHRRAVSSYLSCATSPQKQLA